MVNAADQRCTLEAKRKKSDHLLEGLAFLLKCDGL
jgi:hypothetical protein